MKQYFPKTAPDQNGEATEKKPPLKGIANGIFDVLEMFAWSVFAVILLFSFGVRLCRVDGASMEDTLYNKQNLLVYSGFYTPEQDDIIVFHLTDDATQKTFVKRVIATGGQTVRINIYTKEILVDGVLYEDSHAVFKHGGSTHNDAIGYYRSLFEGNPYFHSDTGIFETTVPENHLFVMGDNRNNSKDSRSSTIGFVDERCVLGKVLLRVIPFEILT
jgi:signal peptidase I